MDQAPYYGIESMWNSSNYWVNLQEGLPVNKMSFDLTSASKWEYMVLDPTMIAMGIEARRIDQASSFHGPTLFSLSTLSPC